MKNTGSASQRHNNRYIGPGESLSGILPGQMLYEYLITGKSRPKILTIQYKYHNRHNADYLQHNEYGCGYE